MEEYDRRMEEIEVAREFPDDVVGRALAAEALDMLRDARGDERERVRNLAREAGTYARIVFARSAFLRSADMDEWFSLPSAGIEALSERMASERASWNLMDDPEEDSSAEIDEAREESGFYGRTLPFDPKSREWIFVRFGEVPRAGRSRFGLAMDDNEDGIDEWRRELGGMTHEAGVSMFRAYRHPSVADAFILIEPQFHLARYGVTDQVEHLLSVMGERGKQSRTFLVSGSLKTVRAMDGSLRAELGSDGEYLLDAFRPHHVMEIDLDRIWINPRTPVGGLVVGACDEVPADPCPASVPRSARI